MHILVYIIDILHKHMYIGPFSKIFMQSLLSM